MKNNDEVLFKTRQWVYRGNALSDLARTSTFRECSPRSLSLLTYVLDVEDPWRRAQERLLR